MIRFIFTMLVLMSFGCGKNVGESQETLTPEQLAQNAMNEGEYQEAIDILAPLVKEDPDFHKRKPLLAAAYAGLVGIDILSLLKNMLSSEGESESPIALVLELLPDDSAEPELKLMDKSITVLNSIPSNLMGPDGDPEFGASAELQRALYQTIHSTLLLKLTLNFDADGIPDAESLRNLSAADARKILASLRSASRGAEGANARRVSAMAGDTVDAIDASEGDTDEERIANYFAE